MVSSHVVGHRSLKQRDNVGGNDRRDNNKDLNNSSVTVNFRISRAPSCRFFRELNSNHAQTKGKLTSNVRTWASGTAKSNASMSQKVLLVVVVISGLWHQRFLMYDTAFLTTNT